MLTQALYSLVAAQKILPTFAVAYCNIGAVLLDQGRIEQAIKFLQTSIELDPMFEPAYINMGNGKKMMI